MSDIGQYEKADFYFNYLLSNFDSQATLLSGIYFNLARIAFFRDQLDESLELCQKSAQWQDIIPQSDRILSKIFHQQGNIYSQMRLFDQALVFYEKSLSVNHSSERGQSESQRTISNLIGIGHIYEQQGKFCQALSQFNQALHLKKKSSDTNDPLIAVLLRNLGELYLKTDDLQSSANCYELSLNIFRKILPFNHPWIFEINHKLADIHLNNSEHDKALDHLKKLLEFYQRYNREIEMADIYAKLSSIYTQKLDYLDALDLAKQRLNILAQYLKPDDPIFIESRTSIDNLRRTIRLLTVNNVTEF